MDNEIESALAYIIENDLATELAFLLDGFSIDVSEEPIFELAFRKGKLKCAKVIFEKGVSEERVIACVYACHGYTAHQFLFLVEHCKVSKSAFPTYIQKRYPEIFPELAKTRRRWFSWCG